MKYCIVMLVRGLSLGLGSRCINLSLSLHMNYKHACIRISDQIIATSHDLTPKGS